MSVQQNYPEEIYDEDTAPSSSVAQDGEDMQLMKKRLQEMESEAEKLREMQEKLEKEEEELKESREDVDARSVFVGNVDFGSTPEELQAHFQSCGSINRVTILCDRFTGQPKGYAYIEFTEPSLVAQALVLNESIFRGRNIKVTPKRTNMPGLSARGGRGRGRGAPFGGRGTFRAGFRGAGAFRGGFRGRARGAFMPY